MCMRESSNNTNFTRICIFTAMNKRYGLYYKISERDILSLEEKIFNMYKVKNYGFTSYKYNSYIQKRHIERF